MRDAAAVALRSGSGSPLMGSDATKPVSTLAKAAGDSLRVMKHVDVGC